MAYLYGDSTPFPLDENFIDTLRDATDICIALLRADESMDAIRRNLEEEKQVAERDKTGVDQLVVAVTKALEPHQASPGSPYVEGVCTRLSQAARAVVEGATKDVVARRDAALRQAESKLVAERSRIPQALERFLLTHEIPNTQWSLSWITRRGTTQTQNQNQANGWALARTPIGLEATFEIDVSQSPLWARPFKVSDLKQEVAIQLPHRGGWLDSGTKMREERLDRYFVTEVSLTPQRAAMVLRRGHKPVGPGLELALDPERKSPPSLKIIGEQQSTTTPEEAVPLDGLDAAVVQELWEMLETRLRPLVKRRIRLAQALLEGAPLSEIQSPARVAQMLIAVTAPFVREMGRRSPVSGELVLKRQVEDGRREEMFISISELTDKFALLSPERQAYFGEYGLVYDVRDVAPGSGAADEAPPASYDSDIAPASSVAVAAQAAATEGSSGADAPAEAAREE